MEAKFIRKITFIAMATFMLAATLTQTANAGSCDSESGSAKAQCNKYLEVFGCDTQDPKGSPAQCAQTAAKHNEITGESIEDLACPCSSYLPADWAFTITDDSRYASICNDGSGGYGVTNIFTDESTDLSFAVSKNINFDCQGSDSYACAVTDQILQPEPVIIREYITLVQYDRCVSVINPG